MTGTQDLQALLEQGGWIQALARRLVADPELASDLAQETWLDALEHRPDAVRPLRAWLGAVMRNNLRRLRRGDGHRGLREERAARAEGTPSTLDVVERAATHRDVVLGVLALEEPYRSTILMRFFDQLSYGEIARRTGTTRATVNSRITRGLERLRERLASAHDHDRRALGLALATLAKPPAALAAPLLGVKLMHATIALTTAALVTLTVSVSLQGRSLDPADPLATRTELSRPAPAPELRAPLAAPERQAVPAQLVAPRQREQTERQQERPRWKTELSHGETFEATLESLVVQTGSGDVELVAARSGLLEVSARISADSEQVAAAELTQVFEDHVRIERASGRLVIEDAHRGERGWSVSLVVGIPRALPVEASSGSGNVSVKQAAGTVRATSGSGDVRVGLREQRLQELQADSASGDVQVEVTAIENRLAATSASGDIAVTMLAWSAVDASLETASGDVCLTLAANATGSFDLATTSGDISVPDGLGLRVEKGPGRSSASGSLGAGGSYHLRSVSGKLALTLR